MAVGRPMAIGDVDACAHSMYKHYQEFCRLAEQLAEHLAPLSDQNVIDLYGYSSTDVTNLKSGVNVSNSLRKLSEGDTDATVETQARQVASLISKFGGVKP